MDFSNLIVAAALEKESDDEEGCEGY